LAGLRLAWSQAATITATSSSARTAGPSSSAAAVGTSAVTLNLRTGPNAGCPDSAPASSGAVPRPNADVALMPVMTTCLDSPVPGVASAICGTFQHLMDRRDRSRYGHHLRQRGVVEL